MSQRNVVFVSFADSVFQRSKQRISFEAAQSGLFNKVMVAGPELFDKDFCHCTGNLMIEKRGFGYWVWKPWIILKTLSLMNENDILWYCDAGCHLNINDESKKRFLSYIDKLVDGKHVFCFPLSYPNQNCFHSNGDWCKYDLLKYFGLELDEEFQNSVQLSATTIGFRKCQQSIEIVQRWFDTSCMKHLIDDSFVINSKIHRPTFKEHRHDMSILNCVLWKNGKEGTFVADSDETWFDNKWHEDGKTFPIWATRLR